MAELGRWGRRDPLGYVDGASVSAYVGSKPVTRRDGSGLFATPSSFSYCEPHAFVAWGYDDPFCVIGVIVAQRHEYGVCVSGQPRKRCVLSLDIRYNIGVTDPTAVGGCRDENSKERAFAVAVWHHDTDGDGLGDSDGEVSVEDGATGGIGSFPNGHSSEGLYRLWNMVMCGTCQQKQVTFRPLHGPWQLTLTINMFCEPCFGG